ncbi:MAG: hypothetical protein WC961_07420 [Anaerovoracaceae bacterium]
MLIKAKLTVWDGIKTAGRVRSSSGTNFVLNTNRMNNFRVRATTKSKFEYTDNLYDRREAPAKVECDSTVATLVTAADATFESNVLPLNYYPGNDPTASTVATYISVDSIAFAYSDVDAHNERSFLVYYNGAGRKNVILVAHNLDQIVDLADYGTTSTTTSSTSTTSTSTEA